jgi:DNA-binding response OmpR family regulator
MVVLMAAKILIVDDDPDMVELLQLALTEAGYSARAATTGTEALAEAQRLSPDLVILDLMLPDLNGFSVCERLRRQPGTASVPIVVITGLGGRFPQLVTSEMGVNAYVNKPFQTQELVSCVDGLLHGSDTAPDLVNGPRTIAA